MSWNKDVDVFHTATVDRFVYRAGWIASAGFVFMLSMVYGLADEIEPLSKPEQEAALIAFYIIALSAVFVLGPVFVAPIFCCRPFRISKIIIVAVLITSSALLTNGLLAFAPVVTRYDKFTLSPVYLVRWCEWIPLAGLMTFISDIVSAPKKDGILRPSLIGLSQTVSCLPAIFFPFCESAWVWGVLMSFAIAFYLVMFPRLWFKYKALYHTNWGTSVADLDNFERHKFGFQLFSVCTGVWTILVILYFVNMLSRRNLPEDHILRHDAFPMLVDASFDVIAKGFYCRLIVDVHHSVFAKEQKSELSSSSKIRS